MRKMPKKSKQNKKAFEREQLSSVSLQSYQAHKEHPSRKKIALETLSRYSGTNIASFQKFILLTNFPLYVEKFAALVDVEVINGPVLKLAHCPKKKITIIDYRVGAPMASLIMDVLSYIQPQCVMMLGLCGGLHHIQKIGDFLLPMAAIRDEGASLHYMPHQVPSLPAFLIQKFISEELMSKKIPFKTGVLHTTDYRMWEFDEKFRARLRDEKASAIDMECSALFTTGFARKVPVGALMLISDLPLTKDGIKTKKSAQEVFERYTKLHLESGIDAIERMQSALKKQKLNFRRFHF